MPALGPNEECISDLAFDEWFAEQLQPGTRSELELHLEHCVRCALRRDVLAAQRAGFLERHPSWDSLASANTRGKAAARPSRWRRTWVWGAGAGAAVAAGFAVLLALPRPAAPPTVRSRGGPQIGAYIKRGTQVTRVQSGDAVRPGDFIRFIYSSQVPVHFGLLNRDARKASIYYPLKAETVLVDPGRDVPLDFSIELDGQPGSERIYGLFCEQPQALEPLRSQLETTSSLPAPAHCRVDVLVLEKEAVVE